GDGQRRRGPAPRPVATVVLQVGRPGLEAQPRGSDQQGLEAWIVHRVAVAEGTASVPALQAVRPVVRRSTPRLFLRYSTSPDGLADDREQEDVLPQERHPRAAAGG